MARAAHRLPLLAGAGLLVLFCTLWVHAPWATGFAQAAGSLPRGPRTAVARAAGASAAAAPPTLYVYDHCPFCVRARMIFGLKGVPHTIAWMANDDVDTPTGLVGKKIAPILAVPGEAPMPESLDIVKRIDEDTTLGPSVLQPATGREDLKAWTKRASGATKQLLRPRYVKAFFAEFAKRSAREAFVGNHAVADPETGEMPAKADWKGMSPDVWNTWYATHFENSEELIKKLNAVTPELEDLIHSEESVSPGGVGYDDITFWDRLRALTLLKGVELGPKAKAYIEKMSEKTDIPLLSAMAM